MPKLPPPPRSPQKRSSFSVSLAVSSLPSAVTTWAEMRLSQARPYLGESQPYPPPRVKPPIPVVVTRPPGEASPYACVSLSYSPHSAPAFARATRCSGSTRTPFMSERSIRSPSLHALLPATLCPPQRTATGRPCSRAKSRATATSATSRGRAISPGRLSIIAFQTRRASSYPEVVRRDDLPVERPFSSRSATPTPVEFIMARLPSLSTREIIRHSVPPIIGQMPYSRRIRDAFTGREDGGLGPGSQSELGEDPTHVM